MAAGRSKQLGRPPAEILAVKVEKIEQEKDQRGPRCRCLKRAGQCLKEVMASGPTPHSPPSRIGLAHVERRHAFGDRRIFVCPIQAWCG